MLVKGRLAKLMIYFLQLIFNVRVHNGGFWQFTFDEVHCNHDSQNSFSVLILSPRHENKLAPPPSPWVSKGHGWTAFVPTKRLFLRHMAFINNKRQDPKK